MTEPLTTAPLRPMFQWMVDVLEVEPTEIHDLWMDTQSSTSFAPFEVDSVLVAIEMLAPFDRARFDGRSDEGRAPAGFVTVATSYTETMRCGGLSVYNAVVDEHGNRFVVLAFDDNGDVDLVVIGPDADGREALIARIEALVAGAASCWRGQRIIIDLTEGRHYRHLPPAAQADCHLDDQLEAELRRNLVVPINQYRSELRPVDRRGVLLHGRPGTGKSWALGWVQAKVAEQASVIVTTPAMFANPFALADLFKMAKLGAPSLVVMEDLDLTVTARSPYGRSDALGELLSYLDGPSRAEGVFVAATTNYIKALDTALTRRPGRFDRRIEVGDATEEARRAVVTEMIERIGADVDQIEAVVSRTNGWSLAELQEAGTLAVLTALDLDQPIDVVAALADVHRREVDGMAMSPTAKAGYA